MRPDTHLVGFPAEATDGGERTGHGRARDVTGGADPADGADTTDTADAPTTGRGARD